MNFCNKNRHRRNVTSHHFFDYYDLRCPNCDQILMSISHQCHDPDQQINMENFHPENGHSKEEDMPECMKRAKKLWKS